MRHNGAMMKLGTSDLTVSPLCLGGNTFGWTANEQESFEVLDAYVAGGGNFIDSADAYSHWIPGNSGGESETILGNWMKARGNRESIVIATKVGMLPGYTALSAENIVTAVDNSLRRLQSDYIDLYYAHKDDPDTDQLETMTAFDGLVKAGKVRNITASNYSADRLQSALDITCANGLTKFVALQNLYNLVERAAYEGPLRDVVERNNLVSLPYYALAKGFLTGKYRAKGETESGRAAGAEVYLDTNGPKVLEAMDVVADAHGCSLTTIALAWLAAQPTIATPIASARVVSQLPDLLAMSSVTLTPDELSLLDAASAPQG
jgi:aryl-alcohol dehydrogenase-like predicted oxidoreductase